MPTTLDDSKRALEAELTLRLLDDVNGERLTSQRSLALRLGIAVGLANAYLKRCVRRGWVNVSRVGERHYAYDLTLQGFAEKSRLATEYLGYSFSFFRNARAQCVDLLKTAQRQGANRILLAGDGDLAEIAILAARDLTVEIVGIWAPRCNRANAAGVPVLVSVPAQDGFDAVLLTDIEAPQQTYDTLRQQLCHHRLLVPGILYVSQRRIVDNPSAKAEAHKASV